MTRRQRRHKGMEKPVVPLSPANGESGCNGKPQYGDYTQANKMAQKASRNLQAAFTPYRCRHCSRWHVGSEAIGNRNYGRRPGWMTRR